MEQPSQHPFTEQASVHPQTLTAYSEGRIAPLRPRPRRSAGTEHTTLDTYIKVHPQVWRIALDLSDNEPWRIEILSETEVMVHNNDQWRNRRKGPDEPLSSEWYSDAAIAKQAEVARLKEAGERPPLTLLLGLFEPRTQPTDDERCSCCGSDAREYVGGEKHDGRRYCALCVGREHHETTHPDR